MPLLSVADYRSAARELVDDKVWDFIEGGAGDEITLNANRHIFDSVQLHPRILVDVSNCDTTSTVFGERLTSPIGLAPMAYHRMAHEEGEIATARAIRGNLFVLSIFASRAFEEVAAAATGPLWLQLYWLQQREVLAELVKRAQDAGYGALVLTVDAPRIGRRLRDLRNGFAIPAHIRAVNLDPELMASSHAGGIAAHAAQTFDQSITWADLAWLRGLTSLPIVLKGVLSPHDAELAIQHGVDAIVVSNHGGRQLDGAVPSLAALPLVADAVAGRCPVLFDGGVRSGRDVFVALALGADMVLIGRPVLWGLAAGGADGVAGVLDTLTGELEHTMALAGRPRIDDIDRSSLWSS